MNRIAARRLRSTAVYILIGLVLGPMVGVLTGALDDLPLLGPALRGMAVGIVLGGAVGIGEEFLMPLASRRLRFLWLNVSRFGAYLLVMQGTLVLINVGSLALAGQETVTAATVRYLGEGFLRDLVFTALASAVIIAVLQLKRLHHAGELWKLVTGRYHYPEEEELVFLFVDLAGSTTIAERLGHIGFSRLLRDMFADLSEPILAWKGRVYQHVGDGVLVTWTSAARDDAAGVHCFFDMVSQLQTHRDHYERIYGLVPTLRGAVHDGPVVTTWVGEARKELAYHGDTLNVTARMQGSCKQLGVQLLVSERIRAGVDRARGLSARPVGEIMLEGKESAASLYSVERVDPAE